MSSLLSYVPLSLMYTLAKDGWGRVRGWNRRVSPAERLALRQKWKPLFEDEIRKNHAKRLRRDVIIRDMRRIDDYPNLDGPQKGISPWFRLGLVGVYHRGIVVAHDWDKLTKDANTGQWRFTDYKAGEEGDIKVLRASYIPFDNIEAVQWEGDEYYSYPHVYCHFHRKNGPYDKSVYCQEYEIEDYFPPQYSEVATLDDVIKTSRKLGVSSSAFHNRENIFKRLYRKVQRTEKPFRAIR